VVSRVSRLQTPPPCSGGLRCCHVSHDFGPRFLAQESSGAATLSKRFCDTFTGAVIGASVVVLLLKGALVSWLLVMDERGGHEDLRGSDRWSIISYVHVKTELYYSNLPCLSLPFHPPL
jgi:hypothetical protein